MSVTVIAEIGVNHQCDLDIAAQLIAVAADCGADVVKFQASTVDEEVSLRAAPDHYADLRTLVPSFEFIERCAQIADQYGIEFLCTPAGEESLEFVAPLVERIKVASDNLTNVPFLRAVAKLNKPVILSTGMGTLPEIARAGAVLGSPRHRLTLLHCVSLYPCPLDVINLSAMDMLRRYGIVGLSDHTTSALVPALAVARGAEVIEKHITLDCGMPGPDHAASLDPNHFRDMVTLVRRAELARGDGVKEPSPYEHEAAQIYRKSIVARVPIKTGEQFTIDNLTTKRPGTGRPAADWDAVISTVARRDYEKDELL